MHFGDKAGNSANKAERSSEYQIGVGSWVRVVIIRVQAWGVPQIPDSLSVCSLTGLETVKSYMFVLSLERSCLNR